MARGALRGAAAAWLGLIALDALVSEHGSKAAGGLIGWAASAINRALSPDVALLPDYSQGSPSASLAPGTDLNPTTTGQASSDGSSGHNYDAGGTTTATLPRSAVINSRPDWMPIPGQPTPY